MPSRAAAIRERLRRGLAAEGYSPLEGRTKSKDFGVVDGPLADAGARRVDTNGSGGGGLAGR